MEETRYIGYNLSRIAMTNILREILITILLALIIFLVVQFSFQSIEVNGSSMETTIEDGQRILVIKAIYWFGDPQRGDVVIFRKPESDRDIIHRVVGLQGEQVEIRSGKLYIDGTMFNEGYTQGDSISVPPQPVPDGCYFIIGTIAVAPAGISCRERI